MSQAECPESEVGGRVGDGAEDELDGLNELMDEDLGEVMLFGLGGKGWVVLYVEETCFLVLGVGVIMRRSHLNGLHGGCCCGLAFVFLLRLDEFVMKLIFDFLDVLISMVFFEMDMLLFSEYEWFGEKHQGDTHHTYQ